MKAVCPKDSEHQRFVTTAHEVHDWVVDSNGDFLEDLGCIEVAHSTDPDNIWTCQECGATAELK